MFGNDTRALYPTRQVKPRCAIGMIKKMPADRSAMR